jgi:hypothetical protein
MAPQEEMERVENGEIQDRQVWMVLRGLQVDEGREVLKETMGNQDQLAHQAE